MRFAEQVAAPVVAQAAARARRRWVRVAVSGLAAAGLAAMLAGCNNSPNPKGSEATNTLFVAFQERSPRHLDPTASYSLNEVPYMYVSTRHLTATTT